MSLRYLYLLPVALLLAACSSEVAYYEAENPRGVVVYLPGTGGDLTDPLGRDLLSALSERGYRGMMIAYPSDWYEGVTCLAIRQKAKAIFAPDGPLAEAYASGLPIVAVGFSQGSWIAHQAGERVSAAVLLSSGTRLGPVPLGCNKAEATALESVLAVSGESDQIYFGDLAAQLGEVTGVDCPGARQCWSERSGWVLALDPEVSDGVADHVFPRLQDDLDPEWISGDGPWARRTVIEWIERHMQR
jgi:hypothetical protein